MRESMVGGTGIEPVTSKSANALPVSGLSTEKAAMGGRKAWRPPQYRALVVVVALHAVLIAALIASSKTIRLSVPAMTLIEVAFLPPATAQRVRTDTSPSHPLERTRVTPSLDATLSLSPELVPAAGSFGVPIDWADQAHTVATSMVANTDAAESGLAPDLAAPRKSVFPDPPAHHAGEQHRLDTGEWIVFISDNCYQISTPTLPNILDNGMGQSTFCLDNTSTPRGDLFDQLPAYARHHPR
jgi:hypothetical protein